MEGHVVHHIEVQVSVGIQVEPGDILGVAIEDLLFESIADVEEGGIVQVLEPGVVQPRLWWHVVEAVISDE